MCVLCVRIVCLINAAAAQQFKIHTCVRLVRESCGPVRCPRANTANGICTITAPELEIFGAALRI